MPCPPWVNLTRRRLRGLLLICVVLLMAPSCLVEPPPEFDTPERTTPKVHTRLVVPPVNRPIVVEWRANGTAEVDFTIPFTTPNSSRLILAFLVTNLGLGLPSEKVVDRKSERG